MKLVKANTFFKNLFFSEKNRLSMQNYLCDMSADGYHLVKIKATKCVFSEEAAKRYVYSLCAEDDGILYDEKSGWEEFLTYKNVRFFRKEVPADAVILNRSFDKKHLSAEISWLRARLAEGLVLIARPNDTYIFRRTDEFKDHDYYIKRTEPSLKGKKNEPSYGIDKYADVKNMRFITVSDSSDVYYFLTDTVVKRSPKDNKGSRLPDQLLALFISTGSALIFCASLLLALFGTINARLNGGSILPWVIGGGACAMVFAILFIAFFLRFQRIAEIRRIRAEEKRARIEAEARLAAAPETEQAAPQPQAPVENNNTNNSIVMNTVVLNNYGKKSDTGTVQGAYGEDEFDPNLRSAMGQIFSGNATELIGQAASDPNGFAENVVNMTSAKSQPEAYYEESDIRKDGSFSMPGQAVLPPVSQISDDEWVDAADDVFDGDDGADDEYFDEEYEKPIGFPIVRFIACAILCFACVVAISLGLRFSISWFISSDKGNVLTLAISLIGIAFSPFLFHYGFKSCKDMLSDGGNEL